MVSGWRGAIRCVKRGLAEQAHLRFDVRAGYVRQLGGRHLQLPALAQRSLVKIERIVREEMDAIGAQEILPAGAESGRSLAGVAAAGT